MAYRLRSATGARPAHRFCG